MYVGAGFVGVGFFVFVTGVVVAVGVLLSTMTKSLPVVVAGVVEALPLNREVIETVAEAKDETTFGTILTIPMLKKTKIRIIAPIITTLKKFLFGEGVVFCVFGSIVFTLYNIATVCQLTHKVF